MSWNISRRDAAETNASPQPTRHKKNPRKPGSSVSDLGHSFFGALLSRFDCRKDQRGHKQPEQDRRDHQRERENHRGHSAHDPANRRVVFAAFAFKLHSANRPLSYGDLNFCHRFGSANLADF